MKSSGDLVLSNPARRHRGRGLLAATVAIALLRLAPAYAADSPDPLAADEYAKRYDVGETVAAERLELQNKAAGIVNALEARLGTDFAGVWFDNAEGQFVVPLVSERDASAVSKQFAEYGVDEKSFRTTTVDSTVSQLEAAQTKVDESIRRLFEERRARSGIDTSTNSVVVEVATGGADAKQLAGLRAQAAALPQKVTIVEAADKDAFDDEPGACAWSGTRNCDPPFHGARRSGSRT